LRDTQDPVEQIGIARTWQAIEAADVALLLVDSQHGLTAAEKAIIDRLPPALPRIKVFNKIDLLGETPRTAPIDDILAVYLSAKSGAGLPLLQAELLRIAGMSQHGEGVFMARTRHVEALRRALTHLEQAREQNKALELFAEELRLTQQALGEITGEFTADDLLGVIFSRFCIGK
jgi:tRNA modification GTPase